MKPEEGDVKKSLLEEAIADVEEALEAYVSHVEPNISKDKKRMAVENMMKTIKDAIEKIENK